MKLSRLLYSLLLLAVLPPAAWPAAGPVAADDVLVRVGVLAHRGREQALQRWSPTADYLSAQVPGYRFEVVPLDLDGMSAAVRNDEIRFTLTNPGNYVDLEARFGASRIATLQTREQGRIHVRYGAVIFTRRDNAAIRGLDDLDGKSFMAVSPEAFGGFQMAWRELAARGIDPFRDFSALRFAGFPQDRIVLAVQRGEVDAATVRAETLARMIESGRVGAEEIRVLAPRGGGSLPVRSTRLYPEWPFATLRNTPRQLATRVAQALLSMPADHPAAQASHTAGWTIPLDYSPVHELMKELRIGPYEALRQTSFPALLRRYAWWFGAAGSLLLALLLLNGYISRTNHRLKVTQQTLQREIAERERSQAALARYRDSLEEQVAARTADLEATNQALERSRVALSELVAITGASGLAHEQKLDRLLETGRDYFGLPVAVLSSVGEDGTRACRVSGDAGLEPGDGGPLQPHCARLLVEKRGEPLDIPDLDRVSELCALPGASRWKSYLGTAVLVHGQVHCTLEFAATEPRAAPLSRWDHELLRVMAQWIGDELERQMALESQQRHQSELARVSRMSTIGEMAASLAHELNQPLTGAINYCNGCLRLLREGGDPERLREGMHKAVESATLAADIIRNIREFVQKEDAERGPVDLNQAVERVASLTALEARRHGVAIELELAPRLPLVEGNMIQLEQVIMNFIRNGIDAMAATRNGARRLSVITEAAGGRVRVRTRDAGEGIAPEALAHIFDAFYTTKPDGMGIGLSISRSIIESHQGRISVRALAPGGTEFAFELPAAAHG